MMVVRRNVTTSKTSFHHIFNRLPLSSPSTLKDGLMWPLLPQTQLLTQAQYFPSTLHPMVFCSTNIFLEGESILIISLSFQSTGSCPNHFHQTALPKVINGSYYSDFPFFVSFVASFFSIHTSNFKVLPPTELPDLANKYVFYQATLTSSLLIHVYPPWEISSMASSCPL